MTDKELLELAAQAAGYTLENRYLAVNLPIEGLHIDAINGEYWPWCIEEGEYWCPLTDDGDALRLAVKLGLLADDGYTATFCNALDKDDPYAATRRAIVRAAAEIGRTM